ncbi:MAG: UDP-N-acetylglucosamine 2-epimerase (non-hydrolyzing) [Candidatus Stygibacter australis]|nr:UDP-N-acetylglucosamine 2-epimerase (non-hydrolyzing) [Candidatus Stygibacter australis]MDP8322598.1 UDP-N-acetylglucosamine 2-epimerase (non-hydrolyzing) [Candidatus Stygibacter australis]
MKILTVIGARPQFIKASVISREIAALSGFKEIIVHTGQHFDENMSQIFFNQMNIPIPDYNLNINSLPHGALTGRMIQGIEEIIMKEKPDWIIVYGDTNSTLAGALAGKKMQYKIAHIEAGLRSFNNDMPEEINRLLTDKISDLLFCPTSTAVGNLALSGITGSKVILSGDIMLDAFLYYLPQAKAPKIKIPPEYLLSTIHRPENTDNPVNLNNIFSALNYIAKDIPLIIPLHPRTTQIIDKTQFDNITFIQPVGYFEMLYLLQHCSLVLTDSGGLQKEAFFMKKPCVTIREETEWSELIQNGFNVLAGSDYNNIISSTSIMLNKEMDFSLELYGKGNAGKIILSELI